MKTENNTNSGNQVAVTPAVAVEAMRRLVAAVSKAEFAGDGGCAFERTVTPTPGGEYVEYSYNWSVELGVPISTPQGHALLTLHAAFSMGAERRGGAFGQARIDIAEAHVVSARFPGEDGQARIKNLGAANIMMAALCAAQPPVFPSERGEGGES